MSLACIILAAGIGSRMKSDKPKVLHELAGRPMINWLLDTVEALEPEKIIVVTGPDMPELLDAVKPHEAVIQESPKGTGDAVKAALPALGDFKGDVLVLLGDAPLVTPNTLSDLIKTRDTAAMAVLGTMLQDPTGYGRLLLDEQGILHRIVEEKDCDDEQRTIQVINTGAFCIDGARLSRWVNKITNDNAQKEYYLTDLPQIAAADGAITKVCVTIDASEVQGCNTRADLSILESVLQNRLRLQMMIDGVSMTDPSSVYLHHDTAIAPGVLIEPNVFFGPGVSVAEDAQIRAFSHLEEAVIGKSAVIGPYARIRPDSVIGEGARIGNFVEIKKSTIGERSKINHLAYVGDCEMGEDVNFSAGAITVNYDGFEKHKTQIGKGVMVGSNVNLVAPISIDDGAFIAAGSTVTEDVPADALSITRDAHNIREGWAAEYRKRKAAIVKKIKEKKKAS